MNHNLIPFLDRPEGKYSPPPPLLEAWNRENICQPWNLKTPSESEYVLHLRINESWDNSV
jgi:hypothetical protein